MGAWQVQGWLEWAIAVSGWLGVAASTQLSLAAAEMGNQAKPAAEMQQPQMLQADAARLYQLGSLAYGKGEYQQALSYFQQALRRYQNGKDQRGTARTLIAIGAVYFKQGEFAQALAVYQQASERLDQTGTAQDPRLLTDQGFVMNNIANIQQILGQYDSALHTYQRSLHLFQRIHDLDHQGKVLFNIGSIQTTRQHYTQALEAYQQALTIHQQTNNLDWQARIFNGLGDLYGKQQQYAKSIELLLQALEILKKSPNPRLQGRTLDSLGDSYKASQQFDLALVAYQSSLALSLASDRTGAAITFGNIGDLFARQGKPQQAIVFYKQSVNTTEQIRQNLRSLSLEQQKSYTQTIAANYRRLADLLLSQGRVLEAQQVLELLKIQEIQLYTRDPSTGQDSSGIAPSLIEQRVIQAHGSFIAFGLKIDQCQQVQCPELSQWLDQREAMRAEFERTLLALEEQIRQSRRRDDDATHPKKVLGNPDAIVSAQPGTVLIYTLVLPDKLWVLWATKGGITKSIAVPTAGQKELSQAVLTYRQLLQNPDSDLSQVQTQGKQLYDWLIPPPLQAELTANQIQHLVFSLDHVTRYLPMAALFDGRQYLVERYTTASIISDQTNLRDRLPVGIQQTSVLALGLTQAAAGFNALPHVFTELDEIVQESPQQNPQDRQGIYPGLMQLNQDFTWRTLRDNISRHPILHIATHGKFEPGNAAASFLVLGNGEKLPIPKIRTLINLGNLHLVVLSACETALGGTGQDGIEISGISSYFLDRGAKAVVASLWAVNDASTSQLMQRFYQNLANSTAQQSISKAEALRAAQIALIQDRKIAGHSDRSSVQFTQPSSSRQPAIAHNLHHPYYWAPFILIGNSL
jgi:CHAT domain-containing protein